MRLTDDFLKEVKEIKSLNDATKLVRLGARIDLQVRNEFGNIDFLNKLTSDFKESTVSKKDFLTAEKLRLKGIYEALNICYGNHITYISGAGMISNYIAFLSEPEIQTLKPQPVKTESGNLLVFPEKTLKDVHRVFNDFFWESVDIDTLKNWFRQIPTGKIKLKEGRRLTGLCYFIGKIEDKKINVSNFGKWMSYHIGKNNYSKLKNEWQKNSSGSEEMKEIDDLIKSL